MDIMSTYKYRVSFFNTKVKRESRNFVGNSLNLMAKLVFGKILFFVTAAFLARHNRNKTKNRVGNSCRHCFCTRNR